MKKKSLFTNNIGLKIVSIFAAILIWLIVVNIDNPSITRSFTISTVELVNEAYIDDTGLVCLRDGEETPIRVTIKGTTKSLKGITESDIHLVADLQQAVSLDTDPVMIPIVASCDGIPSSAISISPQNLNVTLEEKVSSEFLVSINNISKVGRGYEIGSQTVTPEKLRITGPESLIGKIDIVNVYPDLDGKTSDYTADESVVVIDKNGDQLSDTAMSNLKIENDGKVSVTTKLWKTRSDISLVAEVLGSPAYGYIVDTVSTVPETITVAGTTEALDALKEENNQISLEGVDISGSSEDVEAKVNLSDILPEDLKLASGTSDEVLVRVSILPDGGKSFSLSTSEILVEGRTEGMQVSFGIDKIELRVKGSESEDGTVYDVEDFDVEDVRASITLEQQEEGTYEVPVTLELPEGYELINGVTTEITIAPISTMAEEEE